VRPYPDDVVASAGESRRSLARGRRDAGPVTNHLAIVLPGRGYTSIGAAIRVPVLALEQRGVIVEDVTYPAPRADGDDWSATCQDVVAQIVERVSAARCDHLTFVAKSLGTRVLAAIASELPAVPTIDAIWLTPLFGHADVAVGAGATCWRSLLVAGTADAYHDPDGFDRVARTLRAATVLVDGADHSLEHPGDALATIETLRTVAAAVLAFVQHV
jgi:hypothetical protein